LKDRKTRRDGFAVDPLPVHVWKRSKEIIRLFISWAKFLKEMEEVWLQTRRKSDTEERWMEQLQKLQAEVWQALRIAELQKVYNSAQEALPDKVRALLDPLEELSSRILLTRKDLDRFLKQWGKLRERIHELRLNETEAARRGLDEMYNIYSTIRLGNRLHEWHDAYGRLRGSLPSKAKLGFVKFDAINNQVIYSRQELQRIWSHSLTNLRQLKFWQIQPWRLTMAVAKDFFLTTSFAFHYREFSKR
jgi:hypothetical protein